MRACGALLGRFCAGVRACERAHLMLQRESGTYMPPDARRCGGGRRRTKRHTMYRGGREIGRSQREYSTVQRALHRGGGAGTACSTSIQDTRSPESTTLWHPPHTPTHPPTHTHPPRMHSVQHKYRMAETRTIRITPGGSVEAHCISHSLSAPTAAHSGADPNLPTRARTHGDLPDTRPILRTPTETLPPPRTRRRRSTLTMKRASTDCRRHACVLVCSYVGTRPR